jgi:DMSO/TMAO reductase YedYZ molybdopterin-dependent catalytic subunit
MNKLSRRKLITTGLGALAGASGLAAAARLAAMYGLIPPDCGGLYGAGHTLTYASQRLLTRHSLAREFPHARISKAPFANSTAPLGVVYERSLAASFADWRLAVDGLVANPASFSLSELRSMPVRSQITHLACEEGWSYIAEWIGVPLSHILDVVGAAPHARYVVYSSFQSDWFDSIDMADAMHPQTLVTHAMNGGDLPTGFGGPIRLRVPRQLGYKSVKFLTRLTVTDSLKKGVNLLDSNYSWYAGI